jgi:hypothetical protein
MEMNTTITVQMTAQGLLIPRTALGDWEREELEAVREKQAIIIRPKPTSGDTRAQVRQALRRAGMLYEPDWETPPPVPSEERARLAKKLSQGQPLSEIIIADREDRV